VTSKENQALGLERVLPIIFEATTRSDDREQYDKVLIAKKCPAYKAGHSLSSAFMRPTIFLVTHCMVPCKNVNKNDDSPTWF